MNITVVISNYTHHHNYIILHIIITTLFLLVFVKGFICHISNVTF